MTTIKTGPGFRLFIPGMLTVIAGIVGCFFSLLPGLLVIALGVYLVISPSGVQIDKGQSRARLYMEFGLFKAGLWKSYLPASGITLDLYTSKGSTRAVGGLQANWYGGTPGRSYLVQLTGADHEPIEVKEIMDYPEARKFGEKLAAELGLPLTDKAEALIDKAASNRAARDPRSRRKK